jgi:N-acyl homoserine lactone hydrolase
MKIHAIQTGSVRIKTAQVEGRGHGVADLRMGHRDP